MEKNVLKKIIITFVVIMLIFNFYSSNFTFAANAWDSGYQTPSQGDEDTEEIPSTTTKSGSINEILEWLETYKNANPEFYRNANSQYATIINSNIKATVKTIAGVEVVTDEAVSGIKEKYKNNVDKIKVTATWTKAGQTGGTNLNPGGYAGGESFKEWFVEVNLTKEDVSEFIKSSENNGGNNPEDEADGGILLEPLFALVNFVADSLTNILGQLMLPDHQDGFEWTSNIKDFQPANLEELKKEDVYRLSTKSFVNIGGTHYYRINYSPEKIFSGEIDLLSIDFISGKNAAGEEIKGDWASIRVVISQWYKVLRMIAIIGLLSVLIYTGIKIIISANAKDKAKYKEWIINWFVAVAILFCMHYIMSFVISVTNEISQLISSASGEIIVEAGKEFDDTTVNTNNVFATNLMGVVRFMVQADNGAKKIGYEVMYIALLFYTIKFTFIYLKRVLNMAFLTLIAPIVALTYPIDKINDGNAQGFSMWLKEYIFNALLQPMHLILYYILVGSAVSIAASNPLYAIVVLMFLTEAEKLLKKIFGFDKASGGTVGGMTGAFAAGAIASNIKNIARLAGGKGGKGGNTEVDDSNALEDAKPTRADRGSSFFGNLPEDEGSAEQPALGSGNDAQEDDEDEENQRRTSYFEDEDDPDGTNIYGGTQPNDTQGGGADEGNETEVPQPDNGNNNNNNDNNGGGPAQPQGPAPKDEKDKGEKKPKSKFIRGMTSVGKHLAKPIWDFDKSGKYNGKRLIRKIGQTALGVGVGITAAAVQAGISITDGKYSPMEGMATFAGGFAGGSQLANGMFGLGDVYDAGANAGDKAAMMERAQESFRNNDKVIAHYKKQYGDDWKNQLERANKNYVTQGVKDTGDQKRCMKFADNKDMRSKYGWSSDEDADKFAGDTLDFRNTLKEQGQLAAVNDLDKRKKYIESICKGMSAEETARITKQYNRAFDAVRDYNDIVYK